MGALDEHARGSGRKEKVVEERSGSSSGKRMGWK